MKNILNTVVLFACAVAVLGSCKEDKLSTFKGGADLFFTYQRPAPTIYGYRFSYNIDDKSYEWRISQNARPLDSLVCTFARIPESQRDSILLVPVSVMGYASDADREVAYEIVEGDADNFEIINSYIPATSADGGIFIRLLRDNLETEFDTYEIRLRLKENDNFTVRYDSIPYSDNTPEQTSVKDFKVIVINSLVKPQYWMAAYMGTWSTPKALLLLNVIGYPETELYPVGRTPDLGVMRAYGGLLQKYLQQMAAAGTPVTYINEKGEEVEMDWGTSV